jgi:hypothetical protein
MYAVERQTVRSIEAFSRIRVALGGTSTEYDGVKPVVSLTFHEKRA